MALVSGAPPVHDWRGAAPGALACFFFFSSRRRHTRLVSDWSSDVCSSDLGFIEAATKDNPSWMKGFLDESQIGRASCRDRVYLWVRAMSVEEKQGQDLTRHGGTTDNTTYQKGAGGRRR